MQIWKTIKFKELEKSKYIRKTDKECNLLAGYKNPNYDVPKGSINITQEVKNNNENFPERRGWRPDSRKKEFTLHYAEIWHKMFNTNLS